MCSVSFACLVSSTLSYACFVYVLVCVFVSVASDVIVSILGFILTSFTYSLCGLGFIYNYVLVFASQFACLIFVSVFVYVFVFVFVYVMFACSCSVVSLFTFTFNVFLFVYVVGAVRVS